MKPFFFFLFLINISYNNLLNNIEIRFIINILLICPVGFTNHYNVLFYFSFYILLWFSYSLFIFDIPMFFYISKI